MSTAGSTAGSRGCSSPARQMVFGTRSLGLEQRKGRRSDGRGVGTGIRECDRAVGFDRVIGSVASHKPAPAPSECWVVALRSSGFKLSICESNRPDACALSARRRRDRQRPKTRVVAGAGLGEPGGVKKSLHARSLSSSSAARRGRIRSSRSHTTARSVSLWEGRAYADVDCISRGGRRRPLA